MAKVKVIDEASRERIAKELGVSLADLNALQSGAAQGVQKGKPRAFFTARSYKAKSGNVTSDLVLCDASAKPHAALAFGKIRDISILPHVGAILLDMLVKARESDSIDELISALDKAVKTARDARPAKETRNAEAETRGTYL